MPDLSRRRFLGLLLATTTLVTGAAKMVEEISVNESVFWAGHNGLWYLEGDSKPQLIKWSGLETPQEWSTDNIRYRVLLAPPVKMGGYASVPFPKWTWNGCA